MCTEICFTVCVDQQLTQRSASLSVLINNWYRDMFLHVCVDLQLVQRSVSLRLEFLCFSLCVDQQLDLFLCVCVDQ